MCAGRISATPTPATAMGRASMAGFLFNVTASVPTPENIATTVSTVTLHSCNRIVRFFHILETLQLKIMLLHIISCYHVTMLFMLQDAMCTDYDRKCIDGTCSCVNDLERLEVGTVPVITSRNGCLYHALQVCKKSSEMFF